MSQKSKTLLILADYFIQKGKVLSEREYRAETDTPIRARLAKRHFSSWARINRMIQVNLPDKYAQITSVEVDLEKLEEAEKQLKEEEVVVKPAIIQPKVADLGAENED